MKTLYIIGGTMGVGKTTTCRILQRQLPNCVFLDGDWCWDMHPFQVTCETKAMVLDNICYLLRSFLRCSAYDNIVFCWVLHQQEILDHILASLDTRDCRVICISLVCTAQALEQRLRADVEAGLRAPDVIPRSTARLPLYPKLNTVPIDVTAISPQQAAAQIQAL